LPAGCGPAAEIAPRFSGGGAGLFFVSIPRLAVASVVVNALPFGRQKHIRHSLELCGQLLANPGNILILFPEGTRTATGQIGEFKPGVGLLVAGKAVPVVPCHLHGAFQAWPKGRFWPRPHKLRLQIGVPRTYAALPPGKESSEQIGGDLRQAVCDLAAAA
jgi:1-acyl-sn-glycerol-3-phosphate acyltransferase